MIIESELRRTDKKMGCFGCKRRDMAKFFRVSIHYKILRINKC